MKFKLFSTVQHVGHSWFKGLGKRYKYKNFMMSFFNILSVYLIFTSFLVCFTLNPVHSVLFLILTFIIASFILILFQIEFLAILFIIIYVGAVAVLFLFVVMMLNIKKTRSNSNFFNKLLAFTLLISIFVYLVLENVFEFFNLHLEVTSLFIIPDVLSDIIWFGQSLYNYNIILVLLGGILLLVAMIGAITLTLDFKPLERVQISNRQIARSASTLELFR